MAQTTISIETQAVLDPKMVFDRQIAGTRGPKIFIHLAILLRKRADSLPKKYF